MGKGAPAGRAELGLRAAAAPVREEGDAGMGRRPSAAGLGQAGARNFFFNIPRKIIHRKINKSPKNIK